LSETGYIALFLLLAGCTVGPNYSRPKVDVPSGFGEISKTTSADPAAQPSRAVNGSESIAQWWKRFSDPELEQFIDEALRTNYDLAIATTRIREARAQWRMDVASLFPEINADAGYSRARGSKNVKLPFGGGSGGGGASAGASGSSPQNTKQAAANSSGTSPATEQSAGPSPFSNQLTPFGKGGLPGVTSDLYQIGFDSTWELDIFGGNRRRAEAAAAEFAGAIEDRRDVLVTLVSEVARNYMELRGAQQRLGVARENLSNQQKVLELVRSQNKAGLTSRLDETRAAAQVATTAATIPPLEASARRAIHTLSILLARQPDDLSRALEQVRPLPNLPPEVPVGLPSELLRRRPDIRRAERQIAAATARVGSAKADLFPKFALTGTMGLDSTSTRNWFDWESRYFLISPTVVWPVFDAGRIVSNIRLQQATRDERVLQYRNAILTALREVEDALVIYATEQAREKSLKDALEENRLSLTLAEDQYRSGLSDFLTVLDAQRSVLASQDALAQSQQAVATELVALYKALGGGWESARP
jgi:NodT family efflux transporter outer membrane factor (OMF) lipoprotein